MANVPRGAPKGKKSFEVFEDVTIDDLTVSTGLTMGTTDVLTLDTIAAISGKALVISGADGYDVKVKLGDDDATESFIIEEVDGDDLFKVGSTGIVTMANGATLNNTAASDTLTIAETKIGLTGVTTQTGQMKQIGEWTTRNAADNSMYHQIAASSGHERGMKVAYEIVSNDGGYFDSMYVNTKVASTSTPGGEIRASEHKVTIEGNCAAGAIATGVYAKVNVSGASAEVSQAIGVDVLLEEESSGTITAGTGIRVQGGDGAIHNGIDLSGDYGLVALKMPSLAGAAITAATIAGAGAPAQGALTGDTGFVGLYKDSADGNAISAIFKYDGLYYHVKLTDTTDS